MEDSPEYHAAAAPLATGGDQKLLSPERLAEIAEQYQLLGEYPTGPQLVDAAEAGQELLWHVAALTTQLQQAEARLRRFDDIVRHNGMMGPDLSHAEVADKVRMLYRDDLDHEMVVVLARNRIITLADLLGKAEARLLEEQAARDEATQRMRAERAEADQFQVQVFALQRRELFLMKLLQEAKATLLRFTAPKLPVLKDLREWAHETYTALCRADEPAVAHQKAGEKGGVERPWCARCPATEADVNAPGFRCQMCRDEGIYSPEELEAGEDRRDDARQLEEEEGGPFGG